MSRLKQYIAPITIATLVTLALLFTGPFSLLTPTQTNVSNQTTMPNMEAIRDHSEYATFEQIYTHQLKYNRKTITKFYNSGDNTTIWVMRMAGYGDSSLFIMKGKV